jgi:predicted TIM-barrel fold metal-dependent hydrolase
MGRLDTPLPAPEVLEGLAERNLVFELMTHPDQLVSSAESLAGVDDLTVVVEHTGWPRADSDEEYELWTSGIDALASLGPQVLCKLSGLAMPFGSMQVDVLGRWVEYALGAFGVDRCFFASNFPVDAVYGTFDELYTTFSELTAGLDETARDKLFAANAERIYRL